MNKLLTYMMAILIICAAGFIVFWFVIHEPFLQKKTEKEAAIKKAKSQAREIKKVESKIKEREVELETEKKNIFRLLCGARDRSIEKFLKEVEDASDKASIGLDNLRIESVIIKDLHSKIPLNLSLSGPYFQIFKFLQLIQKNGKLDFSTGYLSIQSEAKTVAIQNLLQYVDKSAKYSPRDEFPNLRVELNANMVVIDPSHLERYQTRDQSNCNEI